MSRLSFLTWAPAGSTKMMGEALEDVAYNLVSFCNLAHWLAMLRSAHLAVTDCHCSLMHFFAFSVCGGFQLFHSLFAFVIFWALRPQAGARHRSWRALRMQPVARLATVYYKVRKLSVQYSPWYETRTQGRNLCFWMNTAYPPTTNTPNL